jgi:hypothetical protein
MIKIETKTVMVTVQELDLSAIPVKDWPEDARNLAARILFSPRGERKQKEDMFWREWLIETVTHQLNNPITLKDL